jgi:hypothetical protein
MGRGFVDEVRREASNHSVEVMAVDCIVETLDDRQAG